MDYKDRFPNGDLPRWNFTDIFHSFMTVFRVLCGEWIETMWDGMLVTDATVLFYSFALYLTGSLTIIHLFVSLLANSNDNEALPVPSTGETNAKKSNEKFNLRNYLREKLAETDSNGPSGELSSNLPKSRTFEWRTVLSFRHNS